MPAARIINGSIPEMLVLYSRKRQKITTRWDDIDLPAVEAIEVTPTFVTRPESASGNETGKRWGDRIAPVTVINEPTTLRIVGLERRNEGGRAWKVVFGDDKLVDLREDVLLEALRTVGTDVDGYLEGTYVWAVVGSQMKLVRVGSTLHEALEAATQRKALKPISARDFKVGTVYRQPNGDRIVYLGKFQTQWIVDINYHRHVYDYHRTRVEALRTVKWAGGLWIKLEGRYNFDRDRDRAKPIKEMFAEVDHYDLQFRNSNPKVVEVVGTVELPDDIVAWVREMGNAANQAMVARYPNTSYLRGFARLFNLALPGPEYVNPIFDPMPPVATADELVGVSLD